MANIVILGVYETKSALDTAELAGASAGDTYIVGSKVPYDLYTFASGAFKKGDKVGTVETLDISIDDVNQDISVRDMFGITFKDGAKSYKLRQTTGHGHIRQDTFELFGV